MKALKTLLCTLALTIGVTALSLGGIKEVSADEIQFQEVPITILDDMNNFDRDAGASWKITTNFPKGYTGTQDYYAKFTLPEDSVVHFKTYVDYSIGYDSDVYLCSNASMGAPILTYGTSSAGSTESKYLTLQAGTYYLKYKIEPRYSPTKDAVCETFTTIAALPSTKTLTVTQTPSSDFKSVSLDISQHLGSPSSVYQYAIAEGDQNATVNWVRFDDTNVSVTSNGTYTIRIDMKDYSSYVYYTFEVTGIDTEAPTITGASNNKYYKKAVTLTFSDTTSGIKSATLNGKAISSGKKVSSNGKYTLKVTDNAGYCKIIKFVVDKKAPTVNVKSKTSNKSVKITYKDKVSGIKSATLNGKKIKSGTTVRAKGSYVLKVKDKAGNTKTVKFKIK